MRKFLKIPIFRLKNTRLLKFTIEINSFAFVNLTIYSLSSNFNAYLIVKKLKTKIPYAFIYNAAALKRYYDKANANDSYRPKTSHRT